VFGDTTDASNDGQAGCGSSWSSPDVWFRFTAPFDGLFFATTNGSGFDTVLSTHEGCPGTLANQIDCNDDSYGLWSSIPIQAVAGEQVLIRLAGAGGATGGYQLTLGTDAAIGGRITAAGGGVPIADVSAKVFNDDGAWIASDWSNANGDYLVTGLAEVEHFVGTAYGAVGFLHELWDNIACPWGPPYSCDPTDGDPVVPSLGATATADFALDEQSVVAGTVTAAVGGAPIVGAAVRLFNEAGNELGSDNAGIDGRYEFTRLPAGSYRLVAGHYDFVAEVWDNHPCPGVGLDSCDPLTGDVILVPSATTVDDVDIALSDQGVIAGAVIESGTGLPIAGIYVHAVDQYLQQNYDAVTQGDGSYAIRGLQTDSYHVFTSSPLHFDELYDGLPCEPDCDWTAGTPVAVTLGATTTGIDFDLVRLGSLSGTVTELGSGMTISDAPVDVFDGQGNYVGHDSTNPGGAFLVDGLLPGNYFVIAGSDDHVNMLFDSIPCPFVNCDPVAGTPVPVSLASTTSGIDFVLEPYGEISGTLREAATGLPIQSAWLVAWHADRGQVDGEYTDSSGEYSFDQLPAGSYFVVSDEGAPYLDQLYDGLPCHGGPSSGCDPTKGTAIAVDPGATTTGIDLDLIDLSLVILIDGFESGATVAWSLTVP
jgi:hypothetical protein